MIETYMMGLKPFFCFYGGKWRAAPRYPAPKHRRVIEPFAGAAGYAMRHHHADVVLVETDPLIASLWRWLIGASEREILTLPLEVGTTVRDLGLAPGPSALIGFWLNKGTSAPAQRPSAWMREGLRPRSFWGVEIRQRIASQVGAIRHWTLIEGNYTDAPDDDATWFVDPPYEGAGQHYRSAPLDYRALGRWCRGRRGQVIVCENEGATWLPFEPYLSIKAREGQGGGRTSAEAVWIRNIAGLS